MGQSGGSFEKKSLEEIKVLESWRKVTPNFGPKYWKSKIWKAGPILSSGYLHQKDETQIFTSKNTGRNQSFQKWKKF